MLIRGAKLQDLEAITRIYNYAVLNTTGTFDSQPKTLEEQSIWFDDHDEKFPIWVCEEGEQVVGWLSLSRWSGRCAYSETGEVSLFVESSQQGRGIGSALMKEAIAHVSKGALHTLLARIGTDNTTSQKLHLKHGFSHIGTMEEVGKKFGRVLGVALYQYLPKT